MKFVVQRDSVCMGDDVYAPHQAELFINETESIEKLIKKILENYKLASVASSKVTWIFILNSIDIARVVVKRDEQIDNQIHIHMFENVSLNLKSENCVYFKYYNDLSK